MAENLGAPMTLTEKLRLLSRMKPGMEFPGFMKNEGGNWGDALAKLCGDAAAEIERLTGDVVIAKAIGRAEANERDRQNGVKS